MSDFPKKPLHQIKYMQISLACGHTREVVFRTTPLIAYRCLICDEHVYVKTQGVEIVAEKSETQTLNEILETMNIPERRRTDLRWLARNMHVLNLNHPQFTQAQELLNDELKKLYRSEQ